MQVGFIGFFFFFLWEGEGIFFSDYDLLSKEVKNTLLKMKRRKLIIYKIQKKRYDRFNSSKLYLSAFEKKKKKKRVIRQEQSKNSAYQKQNLSTCVSNVENQLIKFELIKIKPGHLM